MQLYFKFFGIVLGEKLQNCSTYSFEPKDVRSGFDVIIKFYKLKQYNH